MKHFTKCLKLLLPVLCFVWGGNLAWGEEVEYSFSSFTSAATVTLNADNNNLTITLAKNNGSSNPAWSSNQARVYAKGSLKIESANKNIVSVVYTYVVNANKSGATPTIDGVSGKTNAGTWNADTKTWTGNDKEITFSTSGNAGNVGFTKIVVTYEDEAPSYTITAQTNNENYGTVELSGSKIIASPKTGFRVSTTTPYEVTAGTATVAQSGNEFTVTPTSTCTVKINFEAIPTHTVTWSVNGATTSGEFAEGATIEFPDDPEDVYEKTFVGWAEATISGTTNTAPSFVTSATMGDGDKTYYAVFAEVVPGDLITKIDTLTLSTTGVSGTSYSTWSNKTAKNGSSAVYAGQCAGGNSAIQLRSDNSNSGVISTTSGGKLKKVVVVWNSNTTKGRTLDIYGRNTPYSAATDLYNAKTQGANLGSIVKDTSTELAITVDSTFIGLRSSSGAMYLDSILVTWETGTPDTYSDYCTTVAAPTTVKNPTFSVDGGDYTETQSVTLSCKTAGADIYYTLDGTTPTTSSTKYTEAISVNRTMTIKAIAVKDGLEDSEVVSATYTLTADAPHFSVEAGTYNVAQNLELSSTTDGSIYYTTDGTTPTSSSNLYSSAISVNRSCTVKAITIKDGWTSSEVVSVVYTLKADAPHFSIEAGTYNVAQSLELTSTTDGDIYYTTDGSTPTNESYLYDGTFMVGTSCTVKAITIKDGWTSSDVASAAYTITLGAPTITNSGSKVTITGVDGVTIYYTLDKSTPDDESTEYTGVFNLAESPTTVKAIAYDAYGNISSVAEKAITFVSGDVIWAEDFSGYKADDVPTAGSNATYEIANASSAKVMEDSYAYGDSPELILYSGKSFTVNITLNRYYNDMILVYRNNNGKFTLSSSTENVVIGSKTADSEDEHLFTVPISVPEFTETLSLTFTSSGNTRLDNFELYATSRSNPSVTVSSAGYATFATDVDVDYSKVAGVTAYKAKVNGDYVTLTEVSTVPANEAVIVAATAGSYSLSLAESASTLSDNDLKVSDGTIKGGSDIYALAQKDDVVGFYLVDESVTIPAGKCYLQTSGEAKARLLFNFGEDVSGIQTVDGATSKVNDGAIYNLSGQRVNASYKGIVIKNGKKYLNK